MVGENGSAAPPGRVVWVAGAGGFVGRHIVRELAGRGYDVRAVVRRAESASALPSTGGVTMVVGDLRKDGDWTESIADADAVVDVVQSRPAPRLTNSVAAQAAAERVEVVERVTAAIRERAPKLRRYVLLGGLDEYERSSTGWTDEETPFTAAPVGFARVGREPLQRLQQLERNGGPPVNDLHCGLIYGPGGWFADLVQHGRKGRLTVVGDGENRLALVHVEDVASAVAQVIERAPPSRRYNLVDDGSPTQREMVEQIGRAVGQRKPPRQVGTWIAGLVAGSVNVETLTADWQVHNQRAKSELGWSLRYPDLPSGIDPTVLAIPT